MSEYILPHVDGYLKLGQDFDCSDIHLAVNSRPTLRRFGQLLPIWEEAPNLTPQDTEVLARGFPVSYTHLDVYKRQVHSKGTWP